jgi:hypothetical protein
VTLAKIDPRAQRVLRGGRTGGDLTGSYPVADARTVADPPPAVGG